MVLLPYCWSRWLTLMFMFILMLLLLSSSESFSRFSQPHRIKRKGLSRKNTIDKAVKIKPNQIESVPPVNIEVTAKGKPSSPLPGVGGFENDPIIAQKEKFDELLDITLKEKGLAVDHINWFIDRCEILIYRTKLCPNSKTMVEDAAESPSITDVEDVQRLLVERIESTAGMEDFLSNFEVLIIFNYL